MHYRFCVGRDEQRSTLFARICPPARRFDNWMSMKSRHAAALSRVLAGLFLSLMTISGIFWVRRAILLRRTAACESPSASTALSIEQELSRYHFDGVVYFAVPYSQGRNL